MSSDYILQLITQHFGWSFTLVLFFVCLILEKLPTNFSPFTMIGNGIRKVINGDTNEALVAIRKELDDMKTENYIRAMNGRKSEILSFSRDLKTFEIDGNINAIDDFEEEDFNHIFESYRDYEALVKKTGLTNGKINRAMQRINRHSELHGFGTEEIIG